MKSPPESTSIEELMARRSSTNLQRDVVRILKRPEFMSEFVASHLSAYAGRDYQDLREWFVKQLLEKCTSLWPQCPLLAQKLLDDKALNAKFWGELYGSRALLRAVSQLKPLTWEDLGLPNSSEALASVLPPEKLKFALRRKLRKDAQEFTKRVEDSEEKCTLGPGLIDFTHPDIDDAWVRAYSLRVFENYAMAPKTREEFAAYGLRLRGDWLRQAPGDSFYSRYEAAKPRMALRKLQHDAWQKKRNVEAFVGVHLASRVPRDAWPKSKAETALFMLYVAEMVMVARSVRAGYSTDEIEVHRRKRKRLHDGKGKEHFDEVERGEVGDV